MITVFALGSWFIAGATWMWLLCQWRQQRRDAQHVCHATLHVHHCRLVGCELDTLVTYNEETGLHELTGYTIMPTALWDERVSTTGGAA